jgi:predicted  nucleic acid-binding Zn-ribbon protein
VQSPQRLAELEPKAAEFADLEERLKAAEASKRRAVEGMKRFHELKKKADEQVGALAQEVAQLRSENTRLQQVMPQRSQALVSPRS